MSAQALVLFFASRHCAISLTYCAARISLLLRRDHKEQAIPYPVKPFAKNLFVQQWVVALAKRQNCRWKTLPHSLAMESTCQVLFRMLRQESINQVAI